MNLSVWSVLKLSSYFLVVLPTVVAFPGVGWLSPHVCKSCSLGIFGRISECCGILALENPTSISPLPLCPDKPRSVHTGIQIPEGTKENKIPQTLPSKKIQKEVRLVHSSHPLQTKFGIYFILFYFIGWDVRSTLPGEGNVFLSHSIHSSYGREGKAFLGSLTQQISFFPARGHWNCGIALGRFCWQAEGAAAPPPPPPCASPGAGGTPGSWNCRKARAERSPLVLQTFALV